jgi:hypothetical protein
MVVKMMNFTEAIHQRIFDVYVGLTASGYDLANPDRVGAIRELLMTENWSQPLRQYFEFARINDGRINPYWPRASILASVSLLVDYLLADQHFDMISAYLQKMDNLSPADVDSAIVQWAADLPEQMLAIRASRTYAQVWSCYQQVIQREISENGIHYQREMSVAQDRLRGLLPVQSASPELIAVLNPLQADPLTDVMDVHGRIFVITSHLRSESCIHELIHILLAPWLRGWKDQIATSTHLLDLGYDRMAFLRYAWDHSAASWSNVFSETLVRVLTVLASDDELEWRLLQIDDLVKQGFIYASPVAGTIIAAMDKEQPLSDEWLNQCLWSCAKLAKHRRNYLCESF